VTEAVADPGYYCHNIQAMAALDYYWDTRAVAALVYHRAAEAVAALGTEAVEL